jgi:Ni/Co efflux regulator RcnB
VRQAPVIVDSNAPRNDAPRDRGGWRGDRGGGGNAAPAARQGGGWTNGERNWRGRGSDQMTTATPDARRDGNWDGGNRNWRGRNGDTGWQGGSRPVTPPSATPGSSPFDRDGDGRVDPYYDRNGNGRVDERWDDNRNGRFDKRWDRNRDGRLDERWDRDRNGELDRRWDRNGNGRVDKRWRDGNRYGWNDHNWGNHGSWNHSWRNDRRYDWWRYRDSHRHLYRAPRYYHPYGYGYGYRRFSIGVYLDSLFFGSRYWIDDPWQYRLPPAYGSYRWVRYYDDVLLVDLRSGRVVDVIHDFFW